jgi:hypothetical protein
MKFSRLSGDMKATASRAPAAGNNQVLSSTQCFLHRDKRVGLRLGDIDISHSRPCTLSPSRRWVFTIVPQVALKKQAQSHIVVFIPEVFEAAMTSLPRRTCRCPTAALTGL